MLIFGCILVFALGLAFTLLVAPKLEKLERLALAWVIGLGLVTQELFLLSVLNINYSLLSVLGFLFLGNLILWFLLRQRIAFKIRLNFSPYFWFRELSLIEQILIILLVILVFGSFVKAIFWPVYYWDALALYDYRAKIFFEAGGIAKSAALSSLPIHTYPPLTSLAHTFVYILGGKNLNPQFIYPLFYLALLLTFYVSVRKYCQRWASLLFTFFLASIPFFVEFAANAYANLPYAFYFGMGTVYFYRFFQEKEKGILVISGILLGLSGWTRSPTEQFFLANLVVLILFCFWKRKHYLTPVVLTFLYSIFSLPWKWYADYVLKRTAVAIEIAQAIGAGTSTPFDLEKFLTVLALLFRSTKGVSGTSLFLAFLVVLLFPKMFKKNIFLFLALLGNLLVFMLGSYFISLSWPDWKDSILNSAHRLSMFLPPIVLYYVALSVPGFLKNKQSLLLCNKEKRK